MHVQGLSLVKVRARQINVKMIIQFLKMGSATCRPLVICQEIDLYKDPFREGSLDSPSREQETMENTLRNLNTKLSALELESNYK